MDFIETELPGCVLIGVKPVGDSRGFFARTFCAEEFAAHGINPALAQASYSFNFRRGTLRGLHFQYAPAMEDRLVRCVRGAIFDVMVDLRPRSPTFGRWVGYELTESNHLQIHSARGFAHGFQTLTDDCIVAYHIAQPYQPELASGVRWDDPDIGVRWPNPPADQSLRDLDLPRLSQLDLGRLEPFAGAVG